MSKITIVLHDLRGGGAEKMMVRLANQMVEDGDYVDMVLITGGGQNKAYLDSRVRLTELDCARTLSAFIPLRKALKDIKPDAILAALTHINVITSIACFSLGWIKRLSVSERNAFSLDKQVNSDPVMKLTYFIAPFVYRLIPRPVIAVSKGVANDLISTTIVRPKDLVTAPNPVITKETIDAAKQAPKHEWLLDKTEKVIVAVGRLAYQKGFDMLLDAMFEINKTLSCRLIIFGEGELRAELQQQIDTLGLTQKVSMPGYTENPIAEMKAADLYVLSSRFEGSPNAIVEAISVGTPVVAFDCPHGAREILKDGEIGALVENQNAKMLEAAIQEGLSQNKLSPTEPILTVEQFTSENSAARYRELILS
ncbi:glycosyltransferase [Glaciecola siphonariae]|uniref:Glycosyltransferase n=1 Tax=Glaciecola siphonariae TaxID=521012 RepID=A0ABV9M1R2_9ALTE